MSVKGPMSSPDKLSMWNWPLRKISMTGSERRCSSLICSMNFPILQGYCQRRRRRSVITEPDGTQRCVPAEKEDKMKITYIGETRTATSVDGNEVKLEKGMQLE